MKRWRFTPHGAVSLRPQAPQHRHRMHESQHGRHGPGASFSPMHGGGGANIPGSQSG